MTRQEQMLYWLVKNPSLMINPCGHVCHFGRGVSERLDCEPTTVCCRCTTPEYLTDRGDCPICPP